MQPRLALAVSLGLAAAAVALVALDLTYTLTARLESQMDGRWTTVSDDQGRYYEPFPVAGSCPTQPLRLVMDNHRPWAADVTAAVSYTDRSGETHSLARQDFSMARFEVEILALDIPPEAFEDPPEAPGEPKFGIRFVELRAIVGDFYLSTCVEGP